MKKTSMRRSLCICVFVAGLVGLVLGTGLPQVGRVKYEFVKKYIDKTVLSGANTTNAALTITRSKTKISNLYEIYYEDIVGFLFHVRFKIRVINLLHINELL